MRGIGADPSASKSPLKPFGSLVFCWLMLLPSYCDAETWHMRDGTTFKSELKNFHVGTQLVEFSTHPQVSIDRLTVADQQRILAWHAASIKPGSKQVRPNGDGFRQPKDWKLADGRAFYGRFTRPVRGEFVEFIDDKGRTLRIPFNEFGYGEQIYIYNRVHSEGNAKMLPEPRHANLPPPLKSELAPGEDGFDPYLIAREAETSYKPYVLMFGAFGLAILLYAMERAKVRLWLMGVFRPR